MQLAENIRFNIELKKSAIVKLQDKDKVEITILRPENYNIIIYIYI